MNVLIYDTEEQIGIAAGNYMCGQVLAKPNSVLGLATGSTPLKPYNHMIRLYEQGAVDFSKVTTFNLDEYCKLDVEDKNSYHSFMHENLFDHINIPKERIHFLDGNAADLDAECKQYEESIRAAGGIDIQLLGIGSNGHIAFNEPGSSLTSRTRVKTLTPETRIANSRFFDNDINKVPKYALTVGVGTLMDAKELLILATGHNKAMAVQQAVEGSVNHMWTITCVQIHPKAIVVCDEPATLELKVKTLKYFCHLESDITEQFAAE